MLFIYFCSVFVHDKLYLNIISRLYYFGLDPVIIIIIIIIII